MATKPTREHERPSLGRLGEAAAVCTLIGMVALIIGWCLLVYDRLIADQAHNERGIVVLLAGLFAVLVGYLVLMAIEESR